MASLYLSQQDASTDIQHDLFRSSRDLDLISNFYFDLSRSDNKYFYAIKREKHDGAIADFFILISFFIW